eukprot:3322354-Amphidinium_carterae.5
MDEPESPRTAPPRKRSRSPSTEGQRSHRGSRPFDSPRSGDHEQSTTDQLRTRLYYHLPAAAPTGGQRSEILAEAEDL